MKVSQSSAQPVKPESGKPAKPSAAQHENARHYAIALEPEWREGSTEKPQPIFTN